MRLFFFAARNRRELLRDSLSYLFCLGLPLLMLAVMTVVNGSIPAEAQLTLFRIDRLGPGIAVFSLTFLMLFAALLLSKDRASAFLLRVYASPLRAGEFILGYTLPLLGIAIGQIAVTLGAAAAVGCFTNVSFRLGPALLAAVVLLPAAVLFIGLGLLFGSLFNEKSAPPVSSMIITLSALLGGIWMDIEALGGSLKAVCRALPFYHAVEAARAAVAGGYAVIPGHVLVVSGYAAAVLALAIFCLRLRMKNEKS